ncbi:hypothetical protein Maes01_02188 [Microbulbifer aestuariivivens]|uniref:Uncharacterized protein n=1 Tax=Microbulbifer aestuariivivens TaxID=1908308 RepID=A0ABP9WQZ3_9GAMM
MKIHAFIILVLFGHPVHAACTESQNNVKMEPKVEILKESVFVGGDNPKIDELNIEVPSVIEGMKLSRILVSDGGILDTPTYKFPVQFSVDQNVAKLSFEVNLKDIGDFNLMYSYKSSECAKAFFKPVRG